MRGEGGMSDVSFGSLSSESTTVDLQIHSNPAARTWACVKVCVEAWAELWAEAWAATM